MTSRRARPSPDWTIIIPVKDTMLAKTRLHHVDQTTRAAFALAFVLDAATAAVGCPGVRRVVAVTNDATAAGALTGAGVEVVPDLPDSGHNPALVHGVRTVRRGDPSAAVAVMSGDLPALRSEHLTSAFASAGDLLSWFVPDAEGVGTTLLAAGPGAPLTPAFGPGSSARHSRLGAVEIASEDLAGLRRDVDTEEDLREAIRIGVGPHTLAALAALEAARK